MRREVWNFKKADWTRLKEDLSEHDWSCLQTLDPNDGAIQFTKVLREYSLDSIGKRVIHEAKSTHPWMTEQIVKLVAERKAVEGTAEETEKRDRCSAKMAQTTME